jgi:hypothetical protein
MGISHLETHTGKTKQFRYQASAPTDPTPEPGEVYIDSTSGSEAIGLRNQSGWVFISLQV